MEPRGKKRDGSQQATQDRYPCLEKIIQADLRVEVTKGSLLEEEEVDLVENVKLAQTWAEIEPFR
jgi:hypothetical protein